MACRTIVNAAKGGQLKALYFHQDHVEEPFAMRSLVTAWIYGSVNGYPQWYPGSTFEEGDPVVGKWACAAAWLRRTLSHASYWLPQPYTARRSTRLLTAKEVQMLLSFLQVSDFDDGTGRIMAEPYLRWFEHDAELAQQVSDAWNTVVKRGEVYSRDCTCKCGTCKAMFRSWE